MERLPALTPAQIADAATRAAAAWRRAALVAFPTETVYGLGADARDPAALARIFAAKGRPTDHPLIVHLPDGAALAGWVAAVPEAARRLADAFWPGPLTLVLPRHASVLDLVTGAQPTIAVRVPAHPVAQALLRAFGGGIAAPSANRFGRVSPTTADHVASDLAEVDDLLLIDGGPCEVGLESTIVDLAGSAPVVRRLGGVSVERVAAVLGLPPEALRAPAGGAARPLPGTLARHYAPATPARVVAIGAGDAAPAGVAVLARRPCPTQRGGLWRELPDDPQRAARVLYAALRDLDVAGAREIWLESVPTTPAWAAIADRLARATTPALEGS